jgi:hypothetical protein
LSEKFGLETFFFSKKKKKKKKKSARKKKKKQNSRPHPPHALKHAPHLGQRRRRHVRRQHPGTHAPEGLERLEQGAEITRLSVHYLLFIYLLIHF